MRQTVALLKTGTAVEKGQCTQILTIMVDRDSEKAEFIVRADGAIAAAIAFVNESRDNADVEAKVVALFTSLIDDDTRELMITEGVLVPLKALAGSANSEVAVAAAAALRKCGSDVGVIDIEDGALIHSRSAVSEKVCSEVAKLASAVSCKAEKDEALAVLTSMFTDDEADGAERVKAAELVHELSVASHIIALLASPDVQPDTQILVAEFISAFVSLTTAKPLIEAGVITPLVGLLAPPAVGWAGAAAAQALEKMCCDRSFIAAGGYASIVKGGAIGLLVGQLTVSCLDIPFYVCCFSCVFVMFHTLVCKHRDNHTHTPLCTVGFCYQMTVGVEGGR